MHEIKSVMRWKVAITFVYFLIVYFEADTGYHSYVFQYIDVWLILLRDLVTLSWI